MTDPHTPTPPAQGPSIENVERWVGRMALRNMAVEDRLASKISQQALEIEALKKKLSPEGK